MADITNDIVKEIISEITHGTKVLMDIYNLGNSNLMNSIEWEYKDDILH